MFRFYFFLFSSAIKIINIYFFLIKEKETRNASNVFRLIFFLSYDMHNLNIYFCYRKRVFFSIEEEKRQEMHLMYFTIFSFFFFSRKICIYILLYGREKNTMHIMYFALRR